MVAYSPHKSNKHIYNGGQLNHINEAIKSSHGFKQNYLRVTSVCNNLR